MSEGLLIAIIGAVVSIAAAYITARTEITRQLTEHAVKLDLLWDVYIRDAVKDARESGLAHKNSPVQITEQWNEMVPEELREQIRKDIIYWLARLRSPYDASIAVYRQHKDALVLIAEEHDIRHTAIIGTLFVQAKNLEEDL